MDTVQQLGKSKLLVPRLGIGVVACGATQPVLRAFTLRR